MASSKGTKIKAKVKAKKSTTSKGKRAKEKNPKLIEEEPKGGKGTKAEIKKPTSTTATRAREKNPNLTEEERKRGRLISLREFGVLLGVSDGRAHQFSKEADFPEIITVKGRRGKLVWSSEAFRWYANRQGSIEIQKLVPEEEGLEARPVEELRLVVAQRKKVDVQRLKMQENLIEIEDVRLVLDQAAGLLCSHLEAIPGRLATDLASLDKPGEIRNKLLTEMRKIRQAISAKCELYKVT